MLRKEQEEVNTLTALLQSREQEADAVTQQNAKLLKELRGCQSELQDLQETHGRLQTTHVRLERDLKQKEEQLERVTEEKEKALANATRLKGEVAFPCAIRTLAVLEYPVPRVPLLLDDGYFIDPGCSLESAERTSTQVTCRANRKKCLTVLYIVEHPNQEGDMCIDWTSQYCWSNGWNCLWRGHSVYRNRPLIPLLGCMNHQQAALLQCPHLPPSFGSSLATVAFLQNGKGKETNEWKCCAPLCNTRWSGTPGGLYTIAVF